MSFIAGCVGIGWTFGVLAQLEDQNAEPIDAWQVGFWANGEWCSEVVLNFKPVALTQFAGKTDTWVVLGMDGEIAWIQGVNGKSPQIRIEQIGDGSLPAFTMIRNFRDGLVATGMGRWVFYLERNRWSNLGSGFAPDQPNELIGFEALESVEGELYACGWRGEIWWCENGLWRLADSPTNLILTSMTAHPAGRLITCGRLGMVLVGRRDSWNIIDHQQTDEDFWSVAVFQGRTYLCSMCAIYELDAERLSPVDDGSDSDSYYSLSANNVIMLSVGENAIRLTDGKDWRDII